MGLKITDVQAGAVLLTIDNNGLICLGNGTPVDQLTISGTAVIDSQGNIVNFRAPGPSLAPNSGTVSVNPGGGSATITTLPGVIPTVQLDATWPSIRTQHILVPLDHCVSTDVFTQASHMRFGASVGSFRIINRTAPSDDGACPTGINNTVTYRWM